MIKSTITKTEYRAIYRLLDKVSPIEYDCGKLCGAACCTAESEEAEMGIYLLPGEDKIHDRADEWLTWSAEEAGDYDFPESWQGKVYFVRCAGPAHCKRELRPIQCRTFPLVPHITEDGELLLIYNDMELPYRCPLIDDVMALDERFCRATYTAWSRLIGDPLIYDLVKMDSEVREESLSDLADMLL
ncbi:MAG: hypothetical protein IIY88_08065 [Eubacterium sp.]|nr:hypothetical protein [Eubacterium sp.]